VTQPKTLNAFHWHPSDHAHMSCVIADDTAMRTTLYNQWLAARKARPDHTADWPAWRTQHEARQRPAASKRQPGGFATHNGTIPGMGREQQLLAAKPAARAVMSSAQGMAPPKPLHIARTPQLPPASPHSGAYSKAGTHGGSAKIHKSARRSKVAA
jgi:hypothetical protein